ncbi:P-loop containing nucleoside triphosphate hydrolase protein [Ramaria rubella]|nr:P-loop containing nucleoside triphosphate hydrolase protein [Ramaria rubella]
MSSTNSQPPEATLIPNRIAPWQLILDVCRRTFSDTLRKTNKTAKDKFSNKKPALVVRRIINSKGQHVATKVDVRSPALCEVLQGLNDDVEGSELSRNPPVVSDNYGLHYPSLFFHSRFALGHRLAEEQKKDCPNDALIADLKTTLRYIEEDHGNDIADMNKLTANQEIIYDLLWALFVPNTLVYHYHHMTEQVQLLRVRRVTYSQRVDKSLYALIECDVISNDGNSFGLAREKLEIDQFHGARRIKDLTVYPLEYHEGRDAIREHTVSRGKRFVAMDRHSYKEISGQAMRETMYERDGFKVKRFKFHTYGRVMIDPVAFRLFEPNCTYNLTIHKRLARGDLTDEQYMICTPIMLGFCFGVKMWGGFAMDRLKDIAWSDEAFHSLVLGAKQKTLIHSLVKQHISHSTHFDDFIPGKGQGIIALLSGSPGCGKTLTAEAVAEITRRPLYAVSAGELGTEPTALDERLARVLELAQMWDAVLLLDEAEVFLQQRSGTDVMRNALVSIFLRQLEYYQGILVLTTNMIHQCDAAFESRIHFSIHYPDLDFESRKGIWKTFFAKATKGREIDEEDLNRLAKHEMNGRQIKNAVSSGQCIALESKAELSVEHIEAVLEVVSDWKSAKPRLLDSELMV